MVQSVTKTQAEILDLFTYEEYLAYQAEPGIIYELFRGHLKKMPTPTGLHTRICNFLIAQLRRYFATHNLELIATEFVGVRTEKDTSRVPDLVVCTQQLWEQVCNRKGAGALDFEEQPLLVVEITSENWREDYLLKRAEYALREIAEYWIVDPKKQRIRVCHHPENEDGYEHSEFLAGQNSISLQFPELILPVEQIFAPPTVESIILEEQQQRQDLEQQLQTERQRAETERQRAESERQRADRLAQRLRELGMDPDAL
jgi:Uma2 family endonuclease